MDVLARIADDVEGGGGVFCRVVVLGRGQSMDRGSQRALLSGSPVLGEKLLDNEKVDHMITYWSSTKSCIV